MGKRTRISCTATGLQYCIEYRSRPSWKKFETTASFDISLHNRKCAGEYLRCQLRWARDLFSRFEISLGDTLQRHNYVSIGHPKLGALSEMDALEVARHEGNEWIKNNSPIINQELGPDQALIRRWDDWQERSDLDRKIKLYESLIQSSPWLLQVLDTDVRRTASQMTESPSSAALERARLFAIEEIAVYDIHSAEKDIFHIYPGSPMRIMRELRKSANTPEAFRKHDYIYLNIREPR